MFLVGFASLSAVASLLIMLYGPMLFLVIGLFSSVYGSFLVARSGLTFTAYALRSAHRMGVALFKTTAQIFVSLRKPAAEPEQKLVQHNHRAPREARELAAMKLYELKEIIAREGIDVSSATGGRQRRTKVDIAEDIVRARQALQQRGRAPSYQIFVKCLSGKTITLDVEADDTVHDLKCKIQDKEGLPVCKQRLLVMSRQLDDDRLLLEYGIVKESTVHITGGVLGGGYGQKNENWNVGVVIFAPKGRAGMQKIGPPRGYVKEILEKRSSEIVDVREHKARNGDRLLQAFFETDRQARSARQGTHQLPRCRVHSRGHERARCCVRRQ